MRPLRVSVIVRAMTETSAPPKRGDSEQRQSSRQWVLRGLTLGIVSLILTQLSGCFSTIPPMTSGSSSPPFEKDYVRRVEAETRKLEQGELDGSKPADKVDKDADLWTRLRDNFRLWDIDHPRIHSETKRLQHSPSSFNALIKRAEPFLHHVLNEVEKRHLPGELALLPAVESGFQPYARSPSGAAGLWQFMPATGRSLGLERDGWYDGRRDVIAATDAALDYLESLNRRLDGEWLHSLAAYNAGGGAVRRAIRKARQAGRPTDFWHLDLPGETDQYVPRLLALAEIIADPGRFGLALPSLDDRPFFEQVATGGQIDLKIAADLADVPIEEVLLLNPGFNRSSTHPKGPHRLLLPVRRADGFRNALAKLAPEQRLRWEHHLVRQGDTLGRIAREYNIDVDAIQQANQLDSSRIRVGKSLQIPLSGEINLAAVSALSGVPRSKVRYKVRKGDSLYRIARRFQVKIADLRRWNSVGRYIRPGQKLTVFVKPGHQTL